MWLLNCSRLPLSDVAIGVTSAPIISTAGSAASQLQPRRRLALRPSSAAAIVEAGLGGDAPPPGNTLRLPPGVSRLPHRLLTSVGRTTAITRPPPALRSPAVVRRRMAQTAMEPRRLFDYLLYRMIDADCDGIIQMDEVYAFLCTCIDDRNAVHGNIDRLFGKAAYTSPLGCTYTPIIK
eukprot:GHVT01029284.1.p1 GENE.GHVT01029284.1~~GHVT01029284.1.p1  ORF type:complete len:179 (+),score=17.24 GHVT01029284.1:593-1129(+)